MGKGAGSASSLGWKNKCDLQEHKPVFKPVCTCDCVWPCDYVHLCVTLYQCVPVCVPLHGTM